MKWYRTQEYYDSRPWRGTWALDGGGALMNQAIHSVDLLTWLMGPVVEVRALTATLAHERIEVEDAAVATLRFANGALGVIEATTAVYPGYLKRIEIHGYDRLRRPRRRGPQGLGLRQTTQGRPGHPRRDGQSRRAPPAGPATRPRSAITATLCNSATSSTPIRKQRPPAIDGREGRRSVEIILAIYKSAESGKAVKLPLKSDPGINRPRETVRKAIAAGGPKTALPPPDHLRCNNLRGDDPA